MKKIEIIVGGTRETELAEEVMGKLLDILDRNKSEDFTVTQLSLPDLKSWQHQGRKDIMIPSFLSKGRCFHD